MKPYNFLNFALMGRRLIYIKPIGCTVTVLDVLIRDFNQLLYFIKFPKVSLKFNFVFIEKVWVIHWQIDIFG